MKINDILWKYGWIPAVVIGLVCISFIVWAIYTEVIYLVKWVVSK